MATPSPTEQIDFERLEAKYVVHPSLVPGIREFIRPFCVPDPNATGPIPEYVLTTLQFDTADYALFRMTREEALNRFKLRVRTYGTDGNSPVFLEVKRKLKGVVVKSRCLIPKGLWGPRLLDGPRRIVPPFRSGRERSHFIDFSQLVDLLDARPVMLIRYTRESYLGANDDYARLTFDRNLLYCPTSDYDLLPRDARWRALDTAQAMDRPYSGLVLELKTYRDAPQWMVDLTQRFGLVRSGFCKYAVAMRLESVYQGVAYSGGVQNCMYSPLGHVG